MTVYYFDNSPVVDKVRISRSPGGRHTAYVHARDGADLKTLELVKHDLTDNLMQWTPLKRDGEYVLEVRNIGNNGKKLLDFLHETGATTGAVRKEVNPENKISLWEKFKANTLRLSGFAYTVGDIGFVSYGWSDSFERQPDGTRKFVNPQNFLAGIFYALGTPFLSVFGTGDKSDVQLRHISFDAIRELEKKGIKIPEGSSIRSVTHKHNSNLWKKFADKAQRYPAEFANSFYGLAGTMVSWRAVEKMIAFRKETMNKVPHARSLPSLLMDFGLGIMTVGAGLVTLFVDEEPRRPDEPRKKGLAGVWQWVEEKPLRTAGYMLIMSSLSQGGSTVAAFTKSQQILHNPSSTAKQIQGAKDELRSLPGRALFVGANGLAEGLMSISSKGHGKGVESDSSLEPSAYAVMADMVLLTPADQRDKTLDAVSEYLAEKDNLNLPKEKIKAAIAQQMEDMKANPWLGAQQEKQAAIEAKAEEPAQVIPSTKWQDSIVSNVQAASVAPSL